VWRQGLSLAQGNTDPPCEACPGCDRSKVGPCGDPINSVAGPDQTDQISQAVWDVSHRGGEPYPDIRRPGGAPALVQ
jgi:hypothetical protein